MCLSLASLYTEILHVYCVYDYYDLCNMQPLMLKQDMTQHAECACISFILTIVWLAHNSCCHCIRT